MRLSLCQDWHCVLDSQGPQQKSMTRDFETVAGRHKRGTRVRFTFENSGGREGLTERERERERERESGEGCEHMGSAMQKVLAY